MQLKIKSQKKFITFPTRLVCITPSYSDYNVKNTNQKTCLYQKRISGKKILQGKSRITNKFKNDQIEFSLNIFCFIRLINKYNKGIIHTLRKELKKVSKPLFYFFKHVRSHCISYIMNPV